MENTMHLNSLFGYWLIKFWTCCSKIFMEKLKQLPVLMVSWAGESSMWSRSQSVQFPLLSNFINLQNHCSSISLYQIYIICADCEKPLVYIRAFNFQHTNSILLAGWGVRGTPKKQQNRFFWGEQIYGGNEMCNLTDQMCLWDMNWSCVLNYTF